MWTLIDGYNLNCSFKLDIYFCNINYFPKVSISRQLQSTLGLFFSQKIFYFLSHLMYFLFLLIFMEVKNHNITTQN